VVAAALRAPMFLTAMITTNKRSVERVTVTACIVICMCNKLHLYTALQQVPLPGVIEAAAQTADVRTLARAGR